MMAKLKIVVIAEQIDNRVLAKKIFDDQNIAIAAYVGSDEAGLVKIKGIYPDIVVCFEEDCERIFAISQKIYVMMPGTSIVLISDSQNTSFLANAIQNGIRMVLSPSLSTVDIVTKLTEVNDLEKKRLTDEQKQKSRSRVISFYSGKGGVGKTTVATNTAIALTQMGKKTMLIDCDLQFGDASLYLDVEPKDTLGELVQENANLTIDTVNNFTILHTSGVHLLAAPRSPEYAEYVTDEHIDKLINLIRPYYEYILIDLPCTLGNTTISALENSDIIYLVSNLDIASMKECNLTIKVLDSLQQKDKVKILINRNGKSAVKSHHYQKSFDIPIAGTLSEDTKRIPSSIDSGSPMVMSQRKSQYVKEIKAFCETLL